MRRVLFLSFLISYSAQSQVSLWQQWEPSSQRTESTEWSSFENYHVELDRSLLEASLPSSQVRLKPFDLPTPDGKLMQFTIETAGLLHPELQRKFPNLKVYKGKNDRGETIRINVDPGGFHAIAFTHQGTIFVDPEADHYVSYYSSDYKKHKHEKHFEEQEPVMTFGQNKIEIRKSQTAARTTGTQLRKYRIAIAADSLYTDHFGGTVEGALAGIITTLNRMTGIYENDLSVTFELVAENDAIIYVDGATDPYKDLGVSAALTANQTNLDDVIGSENYDIGHIFTNPGDGLGTGLASLGVVCNDQSKARGITGTSPPEGDPFAVDFVAHEIGHQFSATHTWNGTESSCTESQRNSSTAVEPGSGSTIMAYAGICGTDDLQDNSDPYFHAASLEQMFDFIEIGGGSTCPETTASSNTPPELQVMEGGQVIPISTPFKLTASGTDTDGDSLTFTWEQMDTGEAGAPSDPQGTAPLFRSFEPTTSGVRYLPSLSTVLGEGTVKGEVLPSSTREMNFRITLRDNSALGGGTASEDLTIDATDDAGPFIVTSQSTADTLAGGSVVLVEWDVANTNLEPVSCEFVSIALSEDGGLNFTSILEESTTNDGAEYVVLPNTPSSDTRIMVSSVGNIFYNINSTGFVIEETQEEGFDLLIKEVPQTTCGDTLEFELQVVAINGFSNAVTLSSEDAPQGLSLNLGSSAVTPGSSTTLRIVNDGGFTGNGSLTMSASAEGSIREHVIDFGFAQTPTEAPNLLNPLHEQTSVSLLTTFTWSAIENIDGYTFELAADDQFEEIVVQENNLQTTSFALSEDLEAKTTYFWRVATTNTCGVGPFAQSLFITSNLGTTELAAEDVPISIVDVSTISSTITINSELEVSDIDVKDLDITHSFVGDLSITLTSPSNTSVLLMSGECSSDDNVFITFDDEASFGVPCPPTDGQAYQPEQPLSAFDGESALGDWVLEVSDDFTGDVGTLNGWKLVVSTFEEAIWLLSSASEPGQVDLSWTNLQTNDGYEVEIAVEDGAFEPLGNTAQNVNSTTVTNLAPTTKYSFRVRAIIADTVSDYSNISPITSLPQIPNPPSDLTEQQSSGFVTLSWTDNDDIEEGFVVERADGGLEDFQEIGRTTANTTTYIDNEVERGTDYAYQIRAFNISGNSEPSNTVLLTVLGIDDIPLEEHVYPNPASQWLRIPSAALTDATHLVISDVQSRKVKKLAIESLKEQYIEVTDLPTGLYFLQIRAGSDLLQVQKFYKE